MLLRKIDHARHMARFYTVEVLPTLFGEWLVHREWGRIGGACQSLRRTVETEDEARALARAKLDEKIRRGYKPVD